VPDQKPPRLTDGERCTRSCSTSAIRWCARSPTSATVDGYRATWARVDAIVVAAPSLDELCRDVGAESPVNLRWVLMHLLEETARHAGHADVLRELIDGRTGR